MEKTKLISLAERFWHEPKTRVIIAGVSWTVDVPFAVERNEATLVLKNNDFTVDVSVDLDAEFTRLSENEWMLAHRFAKPSLLPPRNNRLVAGEMYQLLFEAGILVDENISFVKSGMGVLRRGNIVFILSEGKTHFRCVTSAGIGYVYRECLCPVPCANNIQRFNEPFVRR